MADTPLLPDGWAEAWASMPAPEFLSWLDREGVTAPHVELLGYHVAELGDGHVAFDWEVPRALLNPAGIAHGGFLAAMLDDAAGMAISSGYPRWVPQLTVNLDVDYLAPVHAGVTHRVEGHLVRRGRSTSLADATITSPDGRLLARGSGVFQPNRRVVPRDMWSLAGLV